MDLETFKIVASGMGKPEPRSFTDAESLELRASGCAVLWGLAALHTAVDGFPAQLTLHGMKGGMVTVRREAGVLRFADFVAARDPEWDVEVDDLLHAVCRAVGVEPSMRNHARIRAVIESALVGTPGNVGRAFSLLPVGTRRATLGRAASVLRALQVVDKDHAERDREAIAFAAEAKAMWEFHHGAVRSRRAEVDPLDVAAASGGLDVRAWLGDERPEPQAARRAAVAAIRAGCLSGLHALAECGLELDAADDRSRRLLTEALTSGPSYATQRLELVRYLAVRQEVVLARDLDGRDARDHANANWWSSSDRDQILKALADAP